MVWCHYLTEQKDTPDAGWLSPCLCAVPKENQEVQALEMLTGTWCFWEHFPNTCSFHLLHPAKGPWGPIAFPTLAEEVMDFLSAAELWACLQW